MALSAEHVPLWLNEIKAEKQGHSFLPAFFPNVLCANSAPPHVSSRGWAQVSESSSNPPPPRPPTLSSSALHCCVPLFIFSLHLLCHIIIYWLSFFLYWPLKLALRWLSGCDLSFLGQMNLWGVNWGTTRPQSPPSFSILSQQNKTGRTTRGEARSSHRLEDIRLLD